MANTDQELKTLNKTVTEAVNILKLYVGNSAQVKAMNEKEREVVEKWLKITDMEEDNQKRQRAFSERQRDEHGRFISKQDKQTKKFMGMAETVKGMFKGVTTGIKAGITNLVNGITSNLSKFFQAIKTQFLGLFGEESEWFELMSSIKDTITGFLGSMISFIWQKTPNWAKKMIKYLGNMYALQVKEFKMDLADIGYDPKKKGVGIGSMITALIALLGGSIGAFLGRYFGFISKLPIFNKIGKMFSVIDDIPFLGKLMKAVKFGFKWLGYPLQLLLGVFDFIKGFKETEGSLWEKIKGGLWEALDGFIRLPIEFITWVTEEVLGLFGIKFDGQEAADKLMDFAKSLFDFILFGWEQLFKAIKLEYDWIKPKLKKWTDLILDHFNPLINLIVNFWNGLIEKAKGLLGKAGIPTDWLDKAKLERREISETGKTARQIAAENEAQKAKQIAEANERLKIIQIEGAKKRKESDENTYLAKALSWLGGGGSSGDSGSDRNQIPDEVDNNIMGINSYNGGMLE